ncbi:MAG: hypothetical protein JJT82_01540 [Legionellaceae bacterium]|nr:hypothetical protein [Legionellaceae bacterium]
MNRIKLLFFIITPLVMLLQSNTVLAEEPPKVLYCPEKIECSKDKSISSCKAIGEHLEHWGNPYAFGTIMKGSHILYEVRSSYQHLNHGIFSLCIYRNDSYPSTKLIVNNFEDIKNANSKTLFWEASLNDKTIWYIDGFSARCMDNEQPLISEKCPLESIPLVRINTSLKSKISKISIYANGVLIQNNSLSIDRDNHVYWMGINMYQSWDACSDTGLCTFELMATINKAFVNIGSIIVDMGNKMKIVYTHATTGFEIYHDEKLNSIEIKTEYHS